MQALRLLWKRLQHARTGASRVRRGGANERATQHEDWDEDAACHGRWSNVGHDNPRRSRGIEKVRQRAQRMIRRKTAPTRGVLRSALADSSRTRHVRYHPSPELEAYVEHYWSVEWDYCGVAPARV